MQRCERCTLIPPCKHITEFDLAQLGRERRCALPKRDAGSITCARFAATGRCPVFNKLGRCSCDHPLNIHTVKYPPARCGVCSLPKPCNKCEYTRRRAELNRFLSDKRTALVSSYRTKKLPEAMELANAKLKGNTMNQVQASKISDRIELCTTLLDKLAKQIEQVRRILSTSMGAETRCLVSEVFPTNILNAFF